MQKNLNYYPNFPIHRLYFGEVETPYRYDEKTSGVRPEEKEDLGRQKLWGEFFSLDYRAYILLMLSYKVEHYIKIF